MSPMRLWWSAFLLLITFAGSIRAGDAPAGGNAGSSIAPAQSAPAEPAPAAAEPVESGKPREDQQTPSASGKSSPAEPDQKPMSEAEPRARPAGGEPGRTELAERRLQALVTRGAALLTQLGQEGADEIDLKRDLQAVIFDFEDFLRAFPKDAMGHAAFGRLLGKVGMRRESVSLLLKANQLDSDIPFVKNQLGNYLAEEGKPLEAVNYFLAAIRLAPREALYHYQLGTLLHEARDDFLKSGDWERPALDQATHDAFRRAAELAPDNFAFAYRYAESFYDLDPAHWDEALKVWGELEDRCAPGLEKETIRLHAANLLIKQGRIDHARLLLSTVVDEKLAAQKQKLLDQLPAIPEK